MRKRDQNEINAAFSVQCQALIASCQAYDSGIAWEALRLAVSVHTLVHDGGKNNRSLLTQMGKRSSMRFLASGRDIANSRNQVADTPMVMIRMSGAGASYLPHLDQGPPIPERWLQIHKWWESDLIYRSGNGASKLTRKKLVFALRNQEGGSHFDLELKDPNYIDMTHGKTWIIRRADGTESELRQLELATMRQVAWELIKSLERVNMLS